MTIKKDYRNSSGLLMGKDGGPEYLTVFNGETGAAMQTVDFDPPRSILTSSEWGDSYANRSEDTLPRWHILTVYIQALL